MKKNLIKNGQRNIRHFPKVDRYMKRYSIYNQGDANQTHNEIPSPHLSEQPFHIGLKIQT